MTVRTKEFKYEITVQGCIENAIDSLLADDKKSREEALEQLLMVMDGTAKWPKMSEAYYNAYETR